MLDSSPYKVMWKFSESQDASREALVRKLHETPIPNDELIDHLPLFSSRNAIGRVLLLHSLYEQILDVHGVVLVFGVRWGRDLAILQSLRSILEPGNAARRIIGFDTFQGFPAVTRLDGEAEVGGYAVSPGYADLLGGLLGDRDGEHQNPYPRRELVEGDAAVTFPRWLEEHPETVVAMAYFDMDLYEPTVACLTSLRPHVTKGSVIGLDEVAHPLFPGETVALKESWGLDRVRLQRTRYAGAPSYFVVE